MNPGALLSLQVHLALIANSHGHISDFVSPLSDHHDHSYIPDTFKSIFRATSANHMRTSKMLEIGMADTDCGERMSHNVNTKFGFFQQFHLIERE